MNGQAERPDDENNELPVTEEVAPAGIEVSELLERADDPLSDLQLAQAKAEENWDRYLRTAAELETSGSVPVEMSKMRIDMPWSDLGASCWP